MLCRAQSDDDAETVDDSGSFSTDRDWVLMGAIPFKTIGIPMSSALDGWGRRFSYAVPQKLAALGTLTSVQLDFRPNIIMFTQEINKDPSSADFNLLMIKPDGGNVDFQNPDDLVVLSHGENAIGAWSVEGTQVSACPSSGATAEERNCNIYNGVSTVEFVDPKGDIVANGAFQNDDILLRKIWKETNFWTQNPSSVFNRYEKGVAIGLGSPEYYLDVRGNIQMSHTDADKGNLRVDRICAAGPGLNDKDCFYPERIGGTGMVCNGLVVGFYGGVPDASGVTPGGVPICANISLTGVSPKNCPSGEAMNGVNADGTVSCKAIP